MDPRNAAAGVAAGQSMPQREQGANSLSEPKQSEKVSHYPGFGQVPPASATKPSAQHIGTTFDGSMGQTHDHGVEGHATGGGWGGQRQRRGAYEMEDAIGGGGGGGAGPRKGQADDGEPRELSNVDTVYYRGVILQKPTGQFRAQIWLDGKNKMIGMFNTAEEAARAYDREAIRTKDNPILNFTLDGSLNPNRNRGLGRPLEDMPLIGNVDEVTPRGKKDKEKRTASNFRGVYRQKTHLKWYASIAVDGKSTYIGVYKTEREAALAHDRAARFMYTNPRCNFHPDGTLNPDRKTRPGGYTFKKRPGASLAEFIELEKKDQQDQQKAADALSAPPPQLPAHGSKQWKAKHIGSRFRGVYKPRGCISWRAYIVMSGQLAHIGTYDKEEDAAKAHDMAAKANLEDPILNFLPNGKVNPDRKKRRPPSMIKRKKRVWNSGPRWGATKRAKGSEGGAGPEETVDYGEDEEWEQMRAYEEGSDEDEDDMRIEEEEGEEEGGGGAGPGAGAGGKTREPPRQVAYI